MSTNLEPLIPARPASRPTLLVQCGFTAALCWWIVLVGVVNSGAGAIFLAVPVLATIATLHQCPSAVGTFWAHFGHIRCKNG